VDLLSIKLSNESGNKDTKKMKRLFNMILIILAGEAVFMLPFLIPRLYRPLMLEGWGLTNTDIGVAFSAYGITAMISYILGGPLADKYHPRHLISLSLALTALGSLYLVFSPSPTSLVVTYSFFGVSTILFLWGALIKSTHIIGKENQRSTALGILDGGRGLLAAVMSSTLVYITSRFYPKLDLKAEQLNALTLIYVFTAGFTLLIALGVWISLKDFKVQDDDTTRWNFKDAVRSLKNTKIWLLSIIILSSYCGYKGIDNYSIYLVDVHHLDVASASRLISVVFWLRPLSAVLTGFLADKFRRKNEGARFTVLMLLLLLGGISQLLLAFTGFNNFTYAVIVILSSAAFAYALRAIYFSVFGDLNIPNYLVGTTVGIVSFVGFLPEIFYGFVTGRFIDSNPGILGFQYAFSFTAVSLFIGAAASYILSRR
jgi:MFS family permease